MARGTLSDADRILRSSETGSAPEAPPAPAARPMTPAHGDPGPAEPFDPARARRSRGLPWGISLTVLVFAAVIGLGAWWSLQPEKFDVAANMRKQIGERGRAVPGTATVAAAIQVAETLLSKPGGYLRNDKMPPGVAMDNMPNWEYGVLTELRDSVRALRNDFSRSQTQSIENDDLKRADSDFNFDADAWVLPATEDEYHQGIEALKGYLAELASGSARARFFARADNLAAYLSVVEKRLGSYGQRLSGSVGNAELLAAFGAEDVLGEGQSALQSAGDSLPRTPWNEIDDVFFEARGYSWALLHMMKALAIDFAPVLRDKNAVVSMQQVIRDLEYATMRKWSPLVLNGDGFGVLANHSLVLASYMSRANAAVLDLRMLLESG